MDSFSNSSGSFFLSSGFVTVLLRDKGWWKTSLQGIETSRHAVRGFFEGDGSRWLHVVRAKGKVYRYWNAGFWFYPPGGFLQEWVSRFLTEHNVEFRQGIAHREERGNKNLGVIKIEKQSQAKKLSDLLYCRSKVWFRGPF